MYTCIGTHSHVQNTTLTALVRSVPGGSTLVTGIASLGGMMLSSVLISILLFCLRRRKRRLLCDLNAQEALDQAVARQGIHPNDLLEAGTKVALKVAVTVAATSAAPVPENDMVDVPLNSPPSDDASTSHVMGSESVTMQ